MVCPHGGVLVSSKQTSCVYPVWEFGQLRASGQHGVEFSMRCRRPPRGGGLLTLQIALSCNIRPAEPSCPNSSACLCSVLRTTATSDALGLPRRALLFSWLLVFVLISSAEASHLCGTVISHPWQHGSCSVEQAAPGEGGTCLICVASQSATVFVASSRWTPPLAISGTLPIADLSTPCCEEEVGLYSRPPPAQ